MSAARIADRDIAERIVRDTLSVMLTGGNPPNWTVQCLADLILEFAACTVESCKGRIPQGWCQMTAEGICDERAAELRAQKRPPKSSAHPEPVKPAPPGSANEKGANANP